MTKIATGTTTTDNPVSKNTSFEFTLKPWKQETEFERFEKLTQKLVNTPKPASQKDED